MSRWGTEFSNPKEPATVDTFLEPHLTDSSSFRATRIHIGPTTASYYDLDWEPLASLITRLQFLEELDFVMHNQFPSSLQQIIYERHPYCRVRVWWRQALVYSLPCLKKKLLATKAGIPDDCDSDINLLHCRGFETIAIYLTQEYDQSRRRTDVDEMFPFLFAVPSLKHLILQRDIEPPDRLPLSVIKDEWRKFAAAENPTPVASLESLTVTLAHESAVLNVARSVDLSCLRSLDILDYKNPTLLAEIARLFHNLERLYISPNPGGRMDPITRTKRHATHFTDDADGITAIQHFAPLKYLWLRALRSPSGLLQVLEQHGPSLKGLILEPTRQARTSNDGGYKYPELNATQVEQLCKLCPNLQELRLQIKRLGGRQQECYIYKALGGLPNLHSLILDLHFEPRPRPLQYTENIDLAIIKEALINAATDERLACDIWDLITSNQPTQHLQNLRLVPFGRDFFPADEKYLLSYFCRSYLLRRYNRYSNTFRVEEFGKEAWSAWREEHLYIEESKEYHIPERLDTLLHELWPAGPGPDGWASGWTSFPLQTNGAASG